VDNDPAARERTAHPCPADDPTSQTETSGTVVIAVVVAAAAVVVVAVVAATETENQPQTVEGRSPKTDYHPLPQHPRRPLADSGWCLR